MIVAALQFDEATHTYTLDGEVLPSVTQILEGVGIIDYSHIPSSTREMALERGRIVHRVTQLDDEGDLDESTVDEAIVPYLGSWRRFRADTGFVPNEVERRGHHQRFRYAGTRDRVGPMNGAAWLVDIKTNDAPEWVRMQTAAYAAFDPEPRRFKRVCVELKATGKVPYRIIERKGSEFGEDFNDFLAALRVWQLRNECNGHLRRRMV